MMIATWKVVRLSTRQQGHAKEAVESEVAGRTNDAICLFLDAIDAARVTTEEVHAQLGEISDRVRRTKKEEDGM